MSPDLFRAALAATFFALPASAGIFSPPPGCEGWLTVQMRSCKVSNHYRCAADAPGDQWRVDFGINGPYFRSRIDYETQWAESHNSDGTVELLEANPADPASFSELIATGRDSYDFAQLASTGVRETVRGYDQLTGQSVTIDGVTLERTKYDARVTYDDGTLAYHAQGSEYIHREWRIFVSGAGRIDLGDGQGPIPQDFTPVEFAFPGEEGFMTTVPTYDCDSVTASLPVVPVAAGD
jgi:hypothetical protein